MLSPSAIRRNSTSLGTLVVGEIQMKSRKARERIRQWAQLHCAQLETNLEKMKAGQPLENIEPLSEEKP